MKKPTVFISYSHADGEFVDQLAEDLKASGVDVWIDKWMIKVGDSITGKIDEAISESDFLIVVLSHASDSSKWVRQELNSALIRNIEQDKRAFILPVLLEDCEIPVLLQDRRCADFRDDYEQGFRELLEGIQPTNQLDVTTGIGRQHPEVLHETPENIQRVRDALSGRGGELLCENLLSLDLSNAVGERIYVPKPATHAPKPDLQSIEQLLVLAATKQNQWLRCNAIELAGNLGFLRSERKELLETIKARVVPKIEDIQKDAFGQEYVQELADLKIALLMRDEKEDREREKRADRLLTRILKTRQSFYQLDIIENPRRYLSFALREPSKWDPVRPYLAVLLTVLVKDRETASSELRGVLFYERSRGKNADGRLIATLQSLTDALA